MGADPTERAASKRDSNPVCIGGKPAGNKLTCWQLPYQRNLAWAKPASLQSRLEAEFGTRPAEAGSTNLENTMKYLFIRRLATIVAVVMLLGPSAMADFTGKSDDPNLLPTAPPEYQVSVFAREPIVRPAKTIAMSKKLEESPVDRLVADFDSSLLHVEEQDKQLRIFLAGKPIVDFVFRDDKILRPYFANARLVNGLQVTRSHPPVKGVDELDHEKLHPGIWLAFGDINGQDFWRNKAAIEHVRFVLAPTIAGGRLRFSTECRLKNSEGEPLCRMTNDFMLTARPHGWLLVWSAEFQADKVAVTFGDQEEMGFGARVATPFTEKNGGLIRSSTGKKTAKQTWGQPATWCDYSGSGPRSGGIMLMASPANFRESWWHNRNYGAFVSNPFGRKAMKQGEVSSISIAPGKTMRLTFGALVHDHQKFEAAAEYEVFKQVISD